VAEDACATVLGAQKRGADDHQQTLRVVFEASLEDAIDPDVNILLGGQVAIEPAGVFVQLRLLQTRDGRGWKGIGLKAGGRQKTKFLHDDAPLKAEFRQALALDLRDLRQSFSKRTRFRRDQIADWCRISAA
jgi:hypothetical protein